MSNLRIPPNSPEAERGVLGSILLDPFVLDRCYLKPEDFFDRRHTVLFESIADLRASNRPMDALTLGEFLKDNGALEKVGGYEYLIELQDATLVPTHIEHYSEIVREKSDARKTLEKAGESIDSIYSGDDSEAVRATLISNMEGIERHTTESTEDIVNEAIEDVDAIVNGDVRALPFPWQEFNRKTMGIPLRAVTPVLGRDGKTKSRNVMSLVAYWLLDCQIPVLVFAFEDGKVRYMQNLASTIGEYDGFTLRRHPSPQYIDNAKRCIEGIGKLPFRVVEESMTAEEVNAEVARFRREQGLKHDQHIAVVVDGFKDILDSGKCESRVQTEAHIFEELKRGAKRNNAAYIDIEHTHDILDDQWLSKRNIKGAKQRSQSSRMFLVLQDAGFPQGLKDKYGIYDEDEYVVLDCQKASYGDKAVVVLKVELEKGRFVEVLPLTNEGGFRDENFKGE